MKDKEYKPEVGDIGLLFGRVVMYTGNQIGDDAPIFMLVGGNGTFTGAKFSDFKVVGLSLERIKERDEKLKTDCLERLKIYSTIKTHGDKEDYITLERAIMVINDAFEEIDTLSADNIRSMIKVLKNVDKP